MTAPFSSYVVPRVDSWPIRQRSSTRWLRGADGWLITAAIALVAMGILAIRVATTAVQGAGPMERQLVWAAISLVAMTVAAISPRAVVQRWAYVAFGLCLALLGAVYWTEPVNGAQRWLRWGPVGLQPSEFTKLAFVAAVARYLASRGGRLTFTHVIVILMLAGAPMALILKQPDLGTALLFVPTLLAMLFGSGIRACYFAVLGLLGLLALPLVWAGMSPFQRARVRSFVVQSDTGTRPHDEGYQLYQSKLMVSLGGVTGAEDATETHLPFDHTDFIFSVIAGQWGLSGVSVTFVLLAVVWWRGLLIASRAVDRFGRLAAVGIVTMLAAQALVNMAMTVGLVPITGLTLPFLSYGGSSLVTSLLAVGALLNIGRSDLRRTLTP